MDGGTGRLGRVITAADLDAAVARIAPRAHRTPVVTCQRLDHACGAAVFLKCENLQKVGAFKFRGAVNAVFSLGDEAAARGVVTHSSGNHGAALALAARLRGVPATVVMPSNSARVKLDAVAGYGARVIQCEPTLAARESTAAAAQAETGATFIHPYDDERIIAGQASAALELLADVPDLDAVIAPVGGGGLLSGTALAAHHRAPGVAVYAAEPTGADDAARSVAAGRLIPIDEGGAQADTVCDGLRTSLSGRTFDIIREHVAEIAVVSDAEAVAAMRAVWSYAKLLIEVSSAVPVAALMAGRLPLAGKRVGVILSGGNVDLDALPW